MSRSWVHKWAYVIGAAVFLAGAAVALTLLTPRRTDCARADALRVAGRYPEALDAYQDLLARDPNHEEALWGVAQVHLARRNPAMALQYLNRYLQKHPKGLHAAEARAALARVRGAYVDSQKPSPELSPGPAPSIPPGPPREIVEAWERAAKLERHSQWLDAITAYAAIAESSADGLVRGAALERMARCEAQRPPFDYQRVRHFYLRAQRAYRDAGDWGNASRCQELAYLAEEYARVKAEREKLAEQQREVAEVAEALVPQPGPREVFEHALSAYRVGDDQTAVQEAEQLKAQVPAAWYVLGMVHARSGDWEAARRELEQYLTREPETEFAAEARRELAEMQGKRPLFLDDFLRPATKWRLDGEKPDVVPATESVAGPDPSDGPCLRLDPGAGTYTSFDQADLATLSLRLHVPPSDAPPLPRTRVQLYGPDVLTCAPLFITSRGYEFFGQTDRPAPLVAGWHRLLIDVTKALVTAQVDGRFVGEVPREGAFAGVHIRTDAAERAGPLYIDDVRVVEHIQPTGEPQ